MIVRAEPAVDEFRPLASAGRLIGDEKAVARAAAMFGVATPPWCSTGF